MSLRCNDFVFTLFRLEENEETRKLEESLGYLKVTIFMHEVINIELDAHPGLAFTALSDLTNYAQWLSFIDKATPVDDEDGNNCWEVTLRARIGPFSRLKKLRMVQVISVPEQEIEFSRSETDGRNHSDWNLNVRIKSTGDTSCMISLSVKYSGGFWSKPLKNTFFDEVEKGTKRLQESFLNDQCEDDSHL